MKFSTELANIQNIPSTDTDFDERPRSEEERVREKDKIRTPPDAKQPTAPIQEPESPDAETPRLMRSRTTSERRIF
jgi:hypothetical protein